MGREILYCTKCGRVLTADDFTRGRAHTFDNRQFCTKCLPPRLENPSTATPRAAKRVPSSARMAPVAPRRSPAPVILSIVAAAAVVGVLVVVLLPAAPPPPAPPEDPAKKVVEQAREFARLQPQALDDIAKRWEQAVAAAGDGAFSAEAKRELDRAVAARKQVQARELQELEEKIRERMQAEQFGAVVDVLEEAKKRRSTPDWAKAVEDRIKEVRATADQRFPALKERAAAAHARADAAQVAELRAKLALWGRKDLTADLEAELAKIVPKEPVPAGAAVLLRYPDPGPRAYNPAGVLKDGALVASPYGNGAVMGGFEVLREPFAIPVKGEFWLTYSTKSPKEIVLRFRILRGDKTFPYNWTLEKPEVGRPARVKAPLRLFMNYDNKYVEVGERVQSIYIQQDDPKAELTFIEAVIFRQD